MSRAIADHSVIQSELWKAIGVALKEHGVDEDTAKEALKRFATSLKS